MNGVVVWWCGHVVVRWWCGTDMVVWWKTLNQRPRLELQNRAPLAPVEYFKNGPPRALSCERSKASTPHVRAPRVSCENSNAGAMRPLASRSSKTSAPRLREENEVEANRAPCEVKARSSRDLRVK